MSLDSPPDLLLHPLRWRIRQVVAAAGRAAPRAIGEALPDVPTATLYRQIAKLTKAGVLTVVDTRQARGATERIYALAAGAPGVAPGPLAETPAPAAPAAGPHEAHRQAFQAFTADLQSAYARYLAREAVDPRRDGVDFHSHALWLSDDELEMVVEGIREALAPALKYGPAPWRKPRSLSTILMPASP